MVLWIKKCSYAIKVTADNLSGFMLKGLAHELPQINKQIIKSETTMRKTFRNSRWPLVALASSCLALTLSCSAETGDEVELEPWQLAEKSEVWEPVPPVVEAPKDAPPSDAIVLFGGDNLSEWVSDKGEKVEWLVADGAMTVVSGTGGIKTKREFCSVQLHMEWRTPTGTDDQEGQGRSNSGVFLQERYEVQVLDSYQNETYPNGQAAAIYKQHIPLVNVTRPPGVWQSYDIIFEAPEFDQNGALSEPAHITVLHNGVLVQNHVEILGATAWIGAPKYDAHGCAPISLQDHSNPVSFRNIWVRPL